MKTLDKVLEVKRIANVHFFDFPRGYKTKEDRHPFHELIFINNGHLYVESEHYGGALKRNEFMIHNSNEYHSLTCPEDADTKVIIIGFECGLRALEELSRRPIRLSDAEIKQLATIVKEGRNVFAPPYNVSVYNMAKRKEQPYGSEQILRSLLEVFLITVIRKYVLFENEDEKGNKGFEISEVVSYIDDNFREKIKIDDLAFLFRTNRSTLCIEFKAATGKTINRYISDKKLAKAKEKLLETDMSVTMIADNLKFESAAYFCMFFKRYTGMTPSEFKEMNKWERNITSVL